MFDHPTINDRFLSGADQLPGDGRMSVAIRISGRWSGTITLGEGRSRLVQADHELSALEWHGRFLRGMAMIFGFVYVWVFLVDGLYLVYVSRSKYYHICGFELSGFRVDRLGYGSSGRIRDREMAIGAFVLS
jgi:hypothetical protein